MAAECEPNLPGRQGLRTTVVEGIVEMPVDLLTIYEWVGRSAGQTEIENPSWSAVEEAIRDLNNRERNDVYLTPDRKDPFCRVTEKRLIYVRL